VIGRPKPAGAPGPTTRLADVLGALSLATDLAAGVPMETSLRTCLVATAIGAALGLDASGLADVYYTALLRHLGCTAYAHEAAAIAAGDDHHLLRTFEGVDAASRVQVVKQAIRHLSAGAPAVQRAASVVRALARPSGRAELARAQCAQASSLAADLGMSAGVVRALEQIYERFDGTGMPGRLGGEAIDRAARVLQAANVLEVHHRTGGEGRASSELRRRRGRQLDPVVADAALEVQGPLRSVLDAPSCWDAYLDAEPAPRQQVVPGGVDAVAIAFARFADLKVPSRVGHSPAVAALASAAAEANGLSAADTQALRRAALLHDLGIVGVPNGIWEKPAALNAAEWERVRMHAYFTERVLTRLPGLDSVASIAGAHHERCDGSGYPGGVRPPPSARAARLLACADVYRALTEPRHHRAARTPDAAAAALRAEAEAGRLCLRAAGCVLAAAGHPPSSKRVRPDVDLSRREIEVLLHVARGETNKQIARALDISPRTVQHHVEHIYEKTGVSTRAAAALFAVRNDLVTALDEETW
jgi:HD-GYP domain-containing protein (c-di-GMP phosphodiesterase class II)